MRRVMPMVAAVVALQPAGVEPAAAPGAAELAPHPSVARAVSIDVELPARASGFVRLTDRRSGVSIRVAAVGAQSVLGERDGDALAFRGAFGDADLLLRRGPDGFEDLTRFPAKPARESAHYDLALDEAAGLRLVDDVLEVLDDGGAPRLRMNRPWIRDRDGRQHRLAVQISGCHADTRPSAPWGRSPLAPGARRCGLRLSWAGLDIPYPALLDPAWSATTSMSMARAAPSVCLTTEGRALVAGGVEGGAPVAAAELFEPGTETWAVTTPMLVARAYAPCVTLADGGVLVAGGFDDLPIGDSDHYDPASGFWSNRRMTVQRAFHTLSLLPDGRALAIGGDDLSSGVLDSLEAYDPTNLEWEPAGALTGPRHFHSAVTLDDGRVLVAGGMSIGSELDTVEIYDPLFQTVSLAAPMAEARIEFPLVRLGARIYAVGGHQDGEQLLGVEAFDPVRGAWEARAPLPFDLEYHRTVPLPSGRLLLVGGAYTGAWLDHAYTYEPAEDVWLVAGVAGARTEHEAIGLADGRTLVVGGYVLPDNEQTATAVLFREIPLGGACVERGECASSACADGVCCASACEGICRACGPTGVCEPVLSGDDADTCSEASTCDPTGVCKSSRGAACATGESCASGRCADGVCCDRACDAQCESCDGVLPGICAPVVGAPRGDRPACVQGSVCNGADDACVSLSLCEDGHVALTSEGERRDCSPYACAPDGACLTRCADVADCVEPLLCDLEGRCVEPRFDQPTAGCAFGGGGLGGAWLVALGLGVAVRRRRRPRRLPQRVRRSPSRRTRGRPQPCPRVF